MIPVVYLGLVGLAGILGGAAIVTYWDDILEWLHAFLPKISELIKLYAKEFGPEFEHTAIIVADVVDAVNAQIEHKLYHKIGHQEWMEETTKRVLKEEELPPAIRRKLEQKRQTASTDKIDITDEIEAEIGMTVG